MNKENTKSRRGIIGELNSYGQHQALYVINRDGDLFYAQCPKCKSTDLKRRTFLGCKSCFTNFQPYYEDGLKYYPVLTEFSKLSAGDKITLVRLKAHFWNPIYGRNENSIKTIKEKVPDAKIITIPPDYRNGKDAHGHSNYSKFLIIPLE